MALVACHRPLKEQTTTRQEEGGEEKKPRSMKSRTQEPAISRKKAQALGGMGNREWEGGWGKRMGKKTMVRKREGGGGRGKEGRQGSHRGSP